MKRSFSFEIWIRRSLTMVVILGAVTVASDREMNLLPSFSFVKTMRGRHWIGTLPVGTALTVSAAESRSVLADEGQMPGFNGNVGWLNSVPLNNKALRGKVVLVNFWTYSCINSLRALPYVKSWAAKYKDDGLVVIGVHTPEFPFEKEQANVQNALREYGVAYPVALDSNYAIWQAFNNEYWPAFYFIDGKGIIRYHQFGEGEYDNAERVLQALLKQNGDAGVSGSIVTVSAHGAEAAPDLQDAQSPETYVGYKQAEHFASPERMAHDSQKAYSAPATLSLNQWGLSGLWNIGSGSGVLQAASGKIIFRFHSRDLHLVLGPAKDGKPIRFRVTVDGAAPGANCGTDSAPDGSGEVREYRLYQLIRQKGPIQDRTFEIEFLDPGVQAYSFTFG
jgi:thiol-disulfide isomerase/thioredoxin